MDLNVNSEPASKRQRHIPLAPPPPPSLPSFAPQNLHPQMYFSPQVPQQQPFWHHFTSAPPPLSSYPIPPTPVPHFGAAGPSWAYTHYSAAPTVAHSFASTAGRWAGSYPPRQLPSALYNNSGGMLNGSQPPGVQAQLQKDEQLAAELQAQYDNEEKQIELDAELSRKLSDGPATFSEISFDSFEDDDGDIEGILFDSHLHVPSGSHSFPSCPHLHRQPATARPDERAIASNSMDSIATLLQTAGSLENIHCPDCQIPLFESADSFVKVVSGWLDGSREVSNAIACHKCSKAWCPSCGDEQEVRGMVEVKGANPEQALSKAKRHLEAFRQNVPEALTRPVPEFCCPSGRMTVIRNLLTFFDASMACRDGQVRKSQMNFAKPVRNHVPSGTGYGSHFMDSDDSAYDEDWSDLSDSPLVPQSQVHPEIEHSKQVKTNGDSNQPAPGKSAAYLKSPSNVTNNVKSGDTDDWYQSSLAALESNKLVKPPNFAAPPANPLPLNAAKEPGSKHSNDWYQSSLAVLEAKTLAKSSNPPALAVEQLPSNAANQSKLTGATDSYRSSSSILESKNLLKAFNIPAGSSKSLDSVSPKTWKDQFKSPPPSTGLFEWSPPKTISGPSLSGTSDTPDVINSKKRGRDDQSSPHSGGLFAWPKSSKPKLASPSHIISTKNIYAKETDPLFHPSTFPPPPHLSSLIHAAKLPKSMGTGYGGGGGPYGPPSAIAQWNHSRRETRLPGVENESEKRRLDQDTFTHRVIALLNKLTESTSKQSYGPQLHFGSLAKVIQDSNLLDAVAEILRNDALEDALARRDVYTAVFQLLMILSSSSESVHLVMSERATKDRSELLYPPKNKGRAKASTTLASLESCMKNLVVQSDNILQRAAKRSERSSDTVDLLRFCEATSSLAAYLVSISSRAGRGPPEQSSPQSKQQDLEKAWADFHTANAFCEAPDVLMFATHFYSSACQSVTQTRPGQVRKLLAEGATLTTSLPAGVFVRHAESRPDLLKALIIGPSDTPYENGLFEFDLWCPPDYPQVPPKCHFKTTGGGTAHMNPNLYRDGKVCLSLLNTWSGEQWTPGRSTLLQVLVSLQAMIFCPNPWYNEPGREHSANDKAAKEYNFEIQHLTVKWGMIQWLERAHANATGRPFVLPSVLQPNGETNRPHRARAMARPLEVDTVWSHVVREFIRTNAEMVRTTVRSWGQTNRYVTTTEVGTVLGLVDHLANMV